MRWASTTGLLATVLLMATALEVGAQGLPIAEFDSLCSSKRNHVVSTLVDGYLEVIVARGDGALYRRTFDFFNETDPNGQGSIGLQELRRNMDVLLEEAEGRGARSQATVGEAFLLTLRQNAMVEPPDVGALLEGMTDVPC